MRSAGAVHSRKNLYAVENTDSLVKQMSKRLVGQGEALAAILPWVEMFQAGLAPAGRPVGVFLLLGPTGTGKTKTVEALAEVLHGSEKKLLKVDCGEFQMEHEVAKLIGAPPGYLGHRETQPIITQQGLQAVTTEKHALSIVLFDEIEKGAEGLRRLLLGILDKATLRLGDNTSVNFEKSLIFLTSNLGAKEMFSEINPDFGFQAGVKKERLNLSGKLQSIGLTAVRKKFSPEFVNRIDSVVTYSPLTVASLKLIIEKLISELRSHISTRLGERAFGITLTASAEAFLLREGTSTQYGARELKRVLHRQITQPLASLIIRGQIRPGSTVTIDENSDGILFDTGLPPNPPAPNLWAA